MLWLDNIIRLFLSIESKYDICFLSWELKNNICLVLIIKRKYDHDDLFEIKLVFPCLDNDEMDIIIRIVLLIELFLLDDNHDIQDQHRWGMHI